MNMTAEDTRTVTQTLMECLDRRDLDGVLAQCAPDAVWHGFGPQPLDNAGYRQAISQFLDGFPDSRFPVEDVVVEGDKAVHRHSLRGTRGAPFWGIPATGKVVVVPA